MNTPNLPPLPSDLGFKFKKHNIEELRILWKVSRRTMLSRIAKIRGLLGCRAGQDYEADQVVIMCMVLEPPDDYYNAYKWMETNGWTDFYAIKYRLEQWMNPATRERMKSEMFGRNEKANKKPKRKK